MEIWNLCLFCVLTWGLVQSPRHCTQIWIEICSHSTFFFNLFYRYTIFQPNFLKCFFKFPAFPLRFCDAQIKNVQKTQGDENTDVIGTTAESAWFNADSNLPIDGAGKAGSYGNLEASVMLKINSHKHTHLLMWREHSLGWKQLFSLCSSEGLQNPTWNRRKSSHMRLNSTLLLPGTHSDI